MPYTQEPKWLVRTDGGGHTESFSTEQDAVDGAEAMLVSPNFEITKAWIFPVSEITHQED